MLHRLTPPASPPARKAAPASSAASGLLPRGRAALIAAMDAGFQPKWKFFWGHHPAPGGGVTASCLSQWWQQPFTVGKETFATAEHYMMVGKARLFGDEAAVQRIFACADPREAKAAGRAVRGYVEDRWREARSAIVVAGNVAKFSQHPELGDFLLATGSDSVLVEASPYDRIWGIGMDTRDARVTNPRQWNGENLLGFALMQARAQLALAREVQNVETAAAYWGSPEAAEENVAPGVRP